MTTTNAEIADLLRRYATVLSLEGADRFKLNAYRRAAETIEKLGEPVTDMLARNEKLTDLPGIGKAINEVILEIIKNQKLERLEQTQSRLSPQRAELADYPGLDPKKVERIYKKLKIGTLAELREQLDAGKIAEALGSRLDFHVRRGLENRPRKLLWEVQELAVRITEYLQGIPNVTQVMEVGSLRRKQDTIGDLNFLFAAASGASVFTQFAKFGPVRSAEKLSVSQRRFRLSAGVDVTLQWTKPEQWGLALLQSTGSPAHLAALQEFAQRTKHTLTIASLTEAGVSVSDEASIYKGLKLQFIEPELREGRGEVEAARLGRLPQLIARSDIRGDLHMHSTSSDGANTIEEMVEAARQLGYSYIAISDHSQSLRLTNGLTEDRLRQQIRTIDHINEQLDGFRILKSAEVDILKDGKLDYSDAMLKELDFTICSIHSHFNLSREQQTERMLRAMDNPYFNIVGHATGRLLLAREGYELDMDRLIEHAKQRHCIFEINANPNRLDLSDEHAKLAKEAGLRLAINTDAHSIRELGYMPAGIHQARRGWLEPSDVINTLSANKLLQFLRRK